MTAIDHLVDRPLVVGLGVTGRAVAGALVRRGADVVVVDDRDDAGLRTAAEGLGVTLVVAPEADAWPGLLADRHAVLPSPGVPDAHPVFAAAAGRVPVLSEFDLAGAWDDRPVAAITGTNGKTTVTTLVTAMLQASGVRAVDAGNTDVPLVAAIESPDVEVFVVEASSFRLGHTQHFAPQVATWLNFSPDHLDIHVSLSAYEQAKARIWRELPADGLAVVNADDPVVVRHAPNRGRVETFGLAGTGDWTERDGWLWQPDGTRLLAIHDLRRSLPHDRSNALAAAATALGVGADLDGIRAALAAFTGLHHRVELVGEWDGVAWFDDSKATTPHATLAALAGFDDVVLVAGGRNKGVDLAALSAGADRIRSVVAIGDAASEVAEAFAGLRPVAVAGDMDEAVALARRAAGSAGVVLLSPGCASFDWYRSYAERGDAFAASVRRIHRIPDHANRTNPTTTDGSPTPGPEVSS